MRILAADQHTMLSDQRLDNIQEDLENPYDAIGEDDVNLDILEEYVKIMETN